MLFYLLLRCAFGERAGRGKSTIDKKLYNNISELFVYVISCFPLEGWKVDRKNEMYSRWEGHRNETVCLGSRRWAVQCSHAGMNIAVQFIVQIKIALVFQ
jgi:hypothetical protein